MSSLEGNKAMIRRYYQEVLNQRKPEMIDQLFAPNFVARNALGPDANLDGFKAAVAMSHNATPDINVVVEDQIAEGDRVTTRWTGVGTHQGTFAGVLATGKKVRVSAIHIHRVVDGRIVELWEQIDLFGLFMQIGFPPAGR